MKPGIALSALFAWTAGSAATAVLVCGCSAGTVLSRDRMDDLRAQGVAPDMVYLVQLPGYELAEQSMSVYDAEGFQTYYVSPQGGQVWLGVERGEFGDSTCEKRPVHDAEPAGGTVRCAYDEVGWYRMSGRWHEYAVAEGGHVIRLGGLRVDVGRAALKEAMAGVRQLNDDGILMRPS